MSFTTSCFLDGVLEGVYKWLTPEPHPSQEMFYSINRTELSATVKGGSGRDGGPWRLLRCEKRRRVC